MKKTIFLALAALVLIGASVYAEAGDSSIILTSLINQDPNPAIVGDIVEIRVGVENRGGVAKENFVLEVIPQYPFTMVPGESSTYQVGTLKAYQYASDMKVIKFKLKVDRDVTAGGYELKLKEYTLGSENISSTKSLTIDVKSRENAEVIHIDKTTLVPGKQSSLKFSINNVGNAPLRDLTFNWENEDKMILPVGSDNTRYVKYIDVGKSAEIEYQVIADPNVQAGLYQLNLYLTYQDSINSSSKMISTIAGINVGGGTDFDVAFSESSNGQTSFSVANIGSNPAYSVSVVVPEQKGIRNPSSVMIGNLNKGDYTVASFSLQPGTSNNILVQVVYTDTMGERNIVEKNVLVNSQTSEVMGAATGQTESNREMMARMHPNQQSVWKNPKVIGSTITSSIVIGGIIFYYRYKKKKLNSPRFKIMELIRGKKK